MSARDTLERFECREQCAERGEPPCFEIDRQAAERGIAGPLEFGPCELCARLTTARLSALAAAGYKILSREPTEAMIEANWGPPSDFSDRLATRAWRAMFDAASPLTDPEKQT